MIPDRGNNQLTLHLTLLSRTRRRFWSIAQNFKQQSKKIRKIIFNFLKLTGYQIRQYALWCGRE